MPTDKSVRLVELLLGDGDERAGIVIAPYGSGKSIAASYALHMIENRADSKSAVRAIARRLEEVSPELAKRAGYRHRSKKQHGLVIPLSGPVASLHKEIPHKVDEALRRFKLGRQARQLVKSEPAQAEELFGYLNILQEKAREWGFDRIAFLWDEFGKHLEFLVQDGRSNQLFHVQKLAEYVARASMPMSFGVVLHMGLLHYANTLSQSARAEWRKVEGRFTTIDYVDDSKQLYLLVARLIRDQRTCAGPKPEEVHSRSELCRAHHLFRGFDAKELDQLIADSYPFSPPAVYLLPRLTGRIAQNERTLFHFLKHWDGKSPIGPAELYDYFSPQLKADISTGGTHRVWLETQSALQKVDADSRLEAVLKAASLFGLGLEGRTGGASLGLLQYAWTTDARREDDDSCPVRTLIDRKLLLYRQYKDEVAVWHGSDLDLRGQLENVKAEKGAAFDLIHFLNSQTPAPYLRPLAYNSEYCVRRFFSGEYRAVISQDAPDSHVEQGDGHIIYWLPTTAADLEKARGLVLKCKDQLTINVIPSEPLPLADAALEVHCLYAMQKDQDLVASDPLALEEISQLASDAEAHLYGLVRRATEPGKSGPIWISEGEEHQFASGEGVRDFLSRVCREQFSMTPKFNNELINKRRPSAVVVNSRKKLVLGILDRAGTPDLGLPETTPDGTMFRSLLLNTGLYRERSAGAWGFAGPEELGSDDEGLNEVWQIIAEFFGETSRAPKPLSQLTSQLKSAPYAIRDGVLPILLAAGIKAFGGGAAIRLKGSLIDDYLPTVIEDMALRPECYSVEPIKLKTSARKTIDQFLHVFGRGSSNEVESDRLRAAGDLLAEWRASLPACARDHDIEDDQLREFRDLVYSENDYVSFFTNGLPQWVAQARPTVEVNESALHAVKMSLERADAPYYNQIAASIRSALGLSLSGSLCKEANEHARLFKDEFLEKVHNEDASKFIRRLRLPSTDDNRFCSSLVQLLIEKRVEECRPNDILLFSRRLNEVVSEIDRAASEADAALFGDGLREWLISNREARLKSLYADLVQLTSDKHASSVMNELAKAQKGAR